MGLLLMVTGLTIAGSRAETPVYELSTMTIRGMICVTPQGNPSSYPGEMSTMAGMGVNLLNSFHGKTSNSRIFLDMADQSGMKCIPSIPLICWIRFGDPPYPKTGDLALRWDNILEWLKLYGYVWPDVPEPFNQGADGTNPLTDEQLEEQVRQTIEELGTSHPSLVGYYAFDEPEANAPGVIDRIARTHAAFCRLGSSADPSFLPPTITGIFTWGSEGQAAAKEYMAKATGYGSPPASKPPLLMYDCYILAYAVGSGFSDYETYANQWVKLGYQYGVPVVVVPQAFNINQRPAPNELRAQAYLALAAGCKGVNWFRFETLAGIGNFTFDEIRGINQDLEVIGPTLMKLTKVQNAATMKGCGGSWFKAGTVNTFLHAESSRKYLFVASKNVTKKDTANITVSKAGVGYAVESILDCMTNRTVEFSDAAASFSFSYGLEPGQGRLFELQGDPSIPIPEAGFACASLLPLLGLVNFLSGGRKKR